MKKIMILLSLFALVACDPVIDDKDMGSIISEDELVLDVHSTTEGGNEISMSNKTPGVGSYWNYVVGTSTKQNETVVLPFVGDQTITFTGFCDGGRVETKRTVHITQIDHDIPEEWINFAGRGMEGKHWTWDFDSNDGVAYGTGGWLTEKYPSWDVKTEEETPEHDCELIFDLNGGPNLTKVDANGNVLEKGTFSFDMSVQKFNPDDGSLWSIGQLKLLDVSVLSGHGFWDESNIISTFEILELTENTMILCWNPADADPWTDGTFWCFKSK